MLPVLAIFNKRTSEPIWQVEQYKRRYVKQIIIPGRTIFLRKISAMVWLSKQLKRTTRENKYNMRNFLQLNYVFSC